MKRKWTRKVDDFIYGIILPIGLLAGAVACATIITIGFMKVFP